MDWFEFCKLNYDMKIATKNDLKIYVNKNKITKEEYKIITKENYM